MLQNGQPNAPLWIFSKFDNGRHQRFRENLKANHFIDAFDIFDNVQPHLATVVFEENLNILLIKNILIIF